MSMQTSPIYLFKGNTKEILIKKLYHFFEDQGEETWQLHITDIPAK